VKSSPVKSSACSFAMPALGVLTILAAAASTRGDVLDATLVGDTYVKASMPDKSFADSEFGLYVRNHRQHGRIALVQFALPKKLCESGSAEEIVDAQLSVMVSFTGWAERDITLELLALDNPGDGKNFDLATLTYDDLVRAGVITGYGEGKFRYGKSVSSVQTLSLFSARGIANATLSFGGKMLLERIRAAILAGQPTLTFAIAPSSSTPPDDVDIRFYSRKTAALSEALSPARLQLTDTAPRDGSHGLRRYFDGWVDATPENTTTVAASDAGKLAPGWIYRGQLPASDKPTIIGDRGWEASGSNVPTLVTTIRGLQPGTEYDVAAIFIGIDPTKREMKWGIDAGFVLQGLIPLTIDSKGVTATGNITTTGTGIQLMAPVGRRAADAHGEIHVYVNTSDYGPGSRTRYAGLGYKVFKKH